MLRRITLAMSRKGAFFPSQTATSQQMPVSSLSFLQKQPPSFETGPNLIWLNVRKRKNCFLALYLHRLVAIFNHFLVEKWMGHLTLKLLWAVRHFLTRNLTNMISVDRPKLCLLYPQSMFLLFFAEIAYIL
jgi:hypothetical protein